MQLNDGRVVTNLIVQALNNEDINNYIHKQEASLMLMTQFWNFSFDEF